MFARALVVLALIAGVMPAQKPGTKKPPAETVAGEVGAALDRRMREVDPDDGGFCGSVLVARKGKILLEKGYGLFDAAKNTPMPVNALWDWASVSKQFTATAVLRLRDAKKLGLDDPLKKFFPEAPPDKAAVTLRQLLTHTSGIESGFKQGWQFDARDRESFVKLALGLPMTSKPGEKFDYSNSGYALVAAIIERVTKTTFEEYCVKQVFEPAGLEAGMFIGWPKLDLGRVPKIERGKGFTDRPTGFAFAYGNELNWGYRGCGGTVMTTHDLFLWDRALRNEKFLSKASREDLYRVALDHYALGWEVRDSPFGRTASHSGGVLGVVTWVLRGLDDDFVVALAHSYRPKGNPGTLATELARIAKDAQ